MGDLSCISLVLEVVSCFGVELFQVWNWLWVQVMSPYSSLGFCSQPHSTVMAR